MPTNHLDWVSWMTHARATDDGSPSCRETRRPSCGTTRFVDDIQAANDTAILSCVDDDKAKLIIVRNAAEAIAEQERRRAAPKAPPILEAYEAGDCAGPAEQVCLPLRLAADSRGAPGRAAGPATNLLPRAQARRVAARRSCPRSRARIRSLVGPGPALPRVRPDAFAIRWLSFGPSFRKAVRRRL